MRGFTSECKKYLFFLIGLIKIGALPTAFAIFEVFLWTRDLAPCSDPLKAYSVECGSQLIKVM